MPTFQTRSDASFDAVLVFHYFNSGGTKLAPVAELIEKLAAAQGTEPGTVLQKKGMTGRAADLLLHGRVLSEAEAERLSGPWNEAEGRMSFMCYMPNHGIATLTDGKVDWLTGICFQCANATQMGTQATRGYRDLDLNINLQDTLLNLLPDRQFPIYP